MNLQDQIKTEAEKSEDQAVFYRDLEDFCAMMADALTEFEEMINEIH